MNIKEINIGDVLLIKNIYIRKYGSTAYLIRDNYPYGPNFLNEDLTPMSTVNPLDFNEACEILVHNITIDGWIIFKYLDSCNVIKKLAARSNIFEKALLTEQEILHNEINDLKNSVDGVLYFTEQLIQKYETEEINKKQGYFSY